MGLMRSWSNPIGVSLFDEWLEDPTRHLPVVEGNVQVRDR
jgi:hypothetical protein